MEYLRFSKILPIAHPPLYGSQVPGQSGPDFPCPLLLFTSPLYQIIRYFALLGPATPNPKNIPPRILGKLRLPGRCHTRNQPPFSAIMGPEREKDFLVFLPHF
jgi:hypothetical protein